MAIYTVMGSYISAILVSILAVVEESLPIAPGSSEAVAIDLANQSILDLMFMAGPVVKGVLAILIFMSVVTWGIVLTKAFQIGRAKKQSAKFSNIFWASRNLAQIHEASGKLNKSPVAAVFGAGYRELTQAVRSRDVRSEDDDFIGIEIIDRALKRAKTEQLTRLEYGSNFLATTASAAPFIGLFGTVWGIMDAFRDLSLAKSSSIQAVAPGISEALIATAIGLAAAIPAAIAFNYFMQQSRVLIRNMDVFSAEFLNIANKHFLN